MTTLEHVLGYHSSEHRAAGCFAVASQAAMRALSAEDVNKKQMFKI